MCISIYLGVKILIRSLMISACEMYTTANYLPLPITCIYTVHKKKYKFNDTVHCVVLMYFFGAAPLSFSYMPFDGFFLMVVYNGSFFILQT